MRINEGISYIFRFKYDLFVEYDYYYVIFILYFMQTLINKTIFDPYSRLRFKIGMIETIL